jgi:MFS family permease
MSDPARLKRRALAFVLTIGALSFFADFTYEGSRSVLGPWLGMLGASALAISASTGAGEFLGYALRLASGPATDRTGSYWPIIIAGYVLQMVSVPAMALVHSWPQAVALLLTERVGKSLRNPPRDALLAHAGQRLGGYGWAFGLHEALDQSGALFGPLLVAGVLAIRHDYRMAYAALAIPAALNLALVLGARWVYPRPQDLEARAVDFEGRGMHPGFWTYLAGAALVAAGFADYPLIAFHWHRDGAVGAEWVPILYAIAMAVSGTGSLLFGRLYDRGGTARIRAPLQALLRTLTTPQAIMKRTSNSGH